MSLNIEVSFAMYYVKFSLCFSVFGSAHLRSVDHFAYKMKETVVTLNNILHSCNKINLGDLLKEFPVSIIKEHGFYSNLSISSVMP